MNMEYPNMRKQVKDEVDKVKEEHLEYLYEIIKSVSQWPEQTPEKKSAEEIGWPQFIVNTYGSLADVPIKRWTEGPYEVREPIE
jgi:hypothetical protein